MTVYTVHLQGEDMQTARFVPEGFAWKAFLVPPLWLAWHRLWLACALWCAAAAIIAFVPMGLSVFAKELFLTLIAVLCGLEGQQWRRMKLMRQGKHLVGLVSGGSRDEAAIRFFHRQEEDVPLVSTAPQPVPPLAPAHNPATEAAFGIFPEPEKRP